MKILHITPSFQHPTMRGPSRHYHFVRELSQRHEITLMTLAQSPVTAEAMEEMSTYTERILTFPVNSASSDSIGAGNAADRGMPGRIRQALALQEAVQRMKKSFDELVRRDSYDAVLFHGKPVYPVIENCELPIVADFCDATSMRIRQKMSHASTTRYPLLLLRYLQIKRIERQLVQKTPFRAFISGRDRLAVMGSDDASAIVPNGVDHAYWTRSSTIEPEPNCIVFTGVMDYAPNDDAALYLIDKIVPLVRGAIPGLKVMIVGRNPSALLQQQARKHPEVVVTGRVDDMRPYLERAALCVAPMRYASGMQNKILEALAMELPVLTTSVAAEGVRMDGEGAPPVEVADGEQAFAQGVIELLRHEARRRRLAIEGRAFVEKHFFWSRSAEKLEQMCVEAIAARVHG